MVVRGDFKHEAKIFLNKMRPTGSKSEPFYKQDGEGSNSHQFACYNRQKKICIFCKKNEDYDSGFCKVKSFIKKYIEDKCM